MRKSNLAVFISALIICFIAISCSKGSGGGGGGSTPNNSLTLTASKISVRADNFDEVIFTVKDESGADVTSSCSFKINGSTYSTNKFHTKAAGNISVTAIKSSSQSNTLTINGTDPGPSPFTQKLYIEDHTGTWCGYCPRVASSLANYAAANPNAIVVGVHGYNGTNDPYIFMYDQQLLNTFNVTG